MRCHESQPRSFGLGTLQMAIESVHSNAASSAEIVDRERILEVGSVLTRFRIPEVALPYWVLWIDAEEPG